MNFVYLHGFNSAYNPDSDKVKHLSKIGSVSGITYNTFGTYNEIYSCISNNVSYSDNLVFVGTSLGGFWASEMGKKFRAPSIIINPCIDPYNMLRKYVGIDQINYLTGANNILLADTVDSYLGHEIVDLNYMYLPLLLLDMGDDVINSHETKSQLSKFPSVLYENGSHRFDHIENALGDIKKYINRCSFIDQANL